MFNEFLSIVVKSLKLDKTLYKDNRNFGEAAIYSKADNKYEIIFNGITYIVELKKIDGGKIRLVINDYQFEVFVSCNNIGDTWLSYNGNTYSLSRTDILPSEKVFSGSGDEEGEGTIVSPMPGKIIKLSQKEGDEIKKGEVLLIVESMKMENNVLAPFDGFLHNYNVKEGDMVDGSIKLAEFEKIEKE